MWDNATGSAATICNAEAFKNGNIKPKRSIIFINYTAEEVGLVGSEYFAKSNLLKDRSVVANINIDMLRSIHKTTELTPEGYNHSTLKESVGFAIEAMNMTINDPTQLEEQYICRSDQMSFIKIGVPTLNIGSGLKSENSYRNIMELLMNWQKTSYHTPFDDRDQYFETKAFHDSLKLNFLVTYFSANESDEIKWNKEGWLYKRYVCNWFE